MLYLTEAEKPIHFTVPSPVQNVPSVLSMLHDPDAHVNTYRRFGVPVVRHRANEVRFKHANDVLVPLQIPQRFPAACSAGQSAIAPFAGVSQKAALSLQTVPAREKKNTFDPNNVCVCNFRQTDWQTWCTLLHVGRYVRKARHKVCLVQTHDTRNGTALLAGALRNGRHSENTQCRQEEVKECKRFEGKSGHFVSLKHDDGTEMRDWMHAKSSTKVGWWYLCDVI